MAFAFEENKSIIAVLNAPDKEIIANLDLLAKDYLEKTGKKVCRSCPSDIRFMILSLKNIYKMTQFKFLRNAASYKNKKGDKTTISNSTMTDEKALNFLKTRPKRIELFSDFPSNWKELIKGKIETEVEKNARLAIEAEAAAVEAAKEAEVKEAAAAEEVPEKKAEEVPVVGAPKENTKKPTLESMKDLSLKDLRAKYPDIKATSIKDFVEKVIAL